jgi:hypothetical protein
MRQPKSNQEGPRQQHQPRQQWDDRERPSTTHDVLLFAQKLFDGVYHILNGTNRFEGFRLDFLARFLLQMNNHVHRINAVQLQVFVKTGFGVMSCGSISNSLVRRPQTS